MLFRFLCEQSSVPAVQAAPSRDCKRSPPLARIASAARHPGRPARFCRKGDAVDVRPETLAEVSALLSDVFLDPEADVKVRLKTILATLAGDEARPLKGHLQEMFTACAQSSVQAAEYVRLFLHGDRGPTVHPYESVHTRGRLMDPECLEDLRSILREADVRLRPDLSIPPDHLGLELEILAYLLAGSKGRPPSGAGSEPRADLLRRLLGSHLLPFAQGFVPKLQAAAPHPYFGAAGEALGDLLALCSRLAGLTSPE